MSTLKNEFSVQVSSVSGDSDIELDYQENDLFAKLSQDEEEQVKPNKNILNTLDDIKAVNLVGKQITAPETSRVIDQEVSKKISHYSSDNLEKTEYKYNKPMPIAWLDYLASRLGTPWLNIKFILPLLSMVAAVWLAMVYEPFAGAPLLLGFSLNVLVPLLLVIYSDVWLRAAAYFFTQVTITPLEAIYEALVKWFFRPLDIAIRQFFALFRADGQAIVPPDAKEGVHNRPAWRFGLLLTMFLSGVLFFSITTAFSIADYLGLHMLIHLTLLQECALNFVLGAVLALSVLVVGPVLHEFVKITLKSLKELPYQAMSLVDQFVKNSLQFVQLCLNMLVQPVRWLASWVVKPDKEGKDDTSSFSFLNANLREKFETIDKARHKLAFTKDVTWLKTASNGLHFFLYPAAATYDAVVGGADNQDKQLEQLSKK